MRTKFLLSIFLLVFGAVLYAQVDTIRTLVISEARLEDQRRAYVEISNVGDDPINLAEFELGVIGAWSVPWANTDNFYMMLPDRVLQPGESFTVANVFDWGPEMFLLAPEDYDPNLTKKEWWTLADIQLHVAESPTGAANDSIHPDYRILELWNGRDCLYLRHHLSNGDSAVIDQVNGIFDATDGTRGLNKGAASVAGYSNATATTTLVRKFKIKQGNIDFVSGKGEDISESEWMPIPNQAGGVWAENVRRLFWTAGNHGNYILDETSLTSDVIEVNWDDNILTVPWGVRRDDSLMFQFDYHPGLAWHYDYNDSYDDSASFAAKTGDTITIYAAGNELDVRAFHIEVADPAEDIAIVVPMRGPNDDGFFEGQADPIYSVTDGLEMDTIGTQRFGGIPYATRVDTLKKYLEKAEGAEWDIIWKDGVERTDLAEGDILEVTAPNGTTKKQYYIKSDKYRPSHNAYLSTITWPDMPPDIKEIRPFGWMGDTIPNFVSTKYNYTVKIPSEAEGIPHLVSKSQNVNSKIAVSPAVDLYSSLEAKTATFTVTAEDDTSMRVYNVQMFKEKQVSDIQPVDLDAFVSQFVWRDQWANSFIELANPTPLPMDMSKYMIAYGWPSNPAELITGYAAIEDWLNRYNKYIPGYKWVDSLAWAVTPVLAAEDVATNAIVAAGDVFVIGEINGTGQSGYPWWASQQCDVLISDAYNPWGQNIGGAGIALWTGATHFALFRIENDSITAGLKPANDPNDFTLIDVFTSGDGSEAVIGGVAINAANQTVSFIRKPEIYQGNPTPKGSFGTDAASSEWIRHDRPFYQARGVPWPNDILFITEDIGSHFMDEVTYFKSTITSEIYIVSEGFSDEESIRGVATEATATDFLANIIKADPGQALTIRNMGVVKGDEDVIVTGDTLIVVSTDLMNTTRYWIEVVDLSDDALLTSETLTIGVEGSAGTITGFGYDAKLRDILGLVEKPAGSTLLVTDSTGKYLPLSILNFDTTYVDVKVTDQIFFQVIAENRVAKIIYQLIPDYEAGDVFVTSDVFGIDQEALLIDLLPGGLDGFPAITAPALLGNLIPSPGATMRVIDKLGFDRTVGFVVKDDKVVVTLVVSDEEKIEKVYYLKMLGDVETALAYVTSTVYIVDQILFSISGDEVTNEITVAAFLANLIPAEGATATVTDASGAPKTSGNLAAGDLLSVVASDGVTENIYIIDVFVSTKDPLDNSIDIYPNPSNGRYYLTGLKAGYRIQVTNILGALVLQKQAVAEKDEISIETEKSGFYFITVNDDKNVVGRYKVVKR
jgi:hypothetical protein